MSNPLKIKIALVRISSGFDGHEKFKRLVTPSQKNNVGICLGGKNFIQISFDGHDTFNGF